jgi:hypothetical protein
MHCMGLGVHFRRDCVWLLIYCHGCRVVQVDAGKDLEGMVKEIQPLCFPPNLIHEQKSYAETLERYVSYTRGGCADALSCDRQRLRSSPSTVLLRGPAYRTGAAWNMAFPPPAASATAEAREAVAHACNAAHEHFVKGMLLNKGNACGTGRGGVPVVHYASVNVVDCDAVYDPQVHRHRHQARSAVVSGCSLLL